MRHTYGGGEVMNVGEKETTTDASVEQIMVMSI